jgi:hypothetical protein
MAAAQPQKSLQEYTGQLSTIFPPRTASKSPNCNNTDSVWVGRKNT